MAVLNVQLSEDKTTKEEAKKTLEPVCPFHIRKPADATPIVCDGLFPRISDQVTIDKETGVVSPVVEKYDLDKEIQTFKDQCGLEYFNLLLKQGRVSPEDSHDDGQHSIDMRVVPDTIHEAKKISDQQGAVLAELAKALGIEDGKAVSQDDLIKMLSDRVAANMAPSRQTERR